MIYVIVVFRTCWSLVFNGLFGSFSNTAAWHGLQLTIEIMQVNQIAANELTHVLVCRYTFINPSDLWHTHTSCHDSWQLCGFSTAVLHVSLHGTEIPDVVGWVDHLDRTQERARAHMCVCVRVCVCLCTCSVSVCVHKNFPTYELTNTLISPITYQNIGAAAGIRAQQAVWLTFQSFSWSKFKAVTSQIEP